MDPSGCQAKWLRRAEISLDVSLLSGRSCRLSMACNATVMDVLRKSREALNVDVSNLETKNGFGWTWSGLGG